VDADGAGQLGHAADQVLDLAGRHHHQVGQLVDDDDDVGERREPEPRGALVEGRDVAGTVAGEELVALLHLLACPAQGGDGGLRLDHHRHQQVGHVGEGAQLDPLGINQDQLELRQVSPGAGIPPGSR